MMYIFYLYFRYILGILPKLYVILLFKKLFCWRLLAVSRVFFFLSLFSYFFRFSPIYIEFVTDKHCMVFYKFVTMILLLPHNILYN